MQPLTTIQIKEAISHCFEILLPTLLMALATVRGTSTRLENRAQGETYKITKCYICLRGRLGVNNAGSSIALLT